MRIISQLDELHLYSLIKSLNRCPNGSWLLITHTEGYFVDITLQGVIEYTYNYFKNKGVI